MISLVSYLQCTTDLSGELCIFSMDHRGAPNTMFGRRWAAARDAAPSRATAGTGRQRASPRSFDLRREAACACRRWHAVSGTFHMRRAAARARPPMGQGRLEEGQARLEEGQHDLFLSFSL